MDTMDKNTLITNACDAVFSYRLAIDNSLATLLDSLKTLVEKCGGLIDTRNNDGIMDNIYGLLFDYDQDRYIEVYIKVIRLKNGYLSILCEPLLTSVDVVYSEEDLISDEFEDDWYPLEMGCDIYYAPTLLSICDCIEQYVKKYMDK